MKTRNLPGIILFAMLAAMLTSNVFAGTKAAKTGDNPRPKAHRLVIVPTEPATAQNGMVVRQALFVEDKELLSRIEAMFPRYHERPDSDQAAGEITGYQLYFEMPDREIIRISVGIISKTWSAGNGTLKMRGDFHALMKEVRKEKIGVPEEDTLENRAKRAAAAWLDFKEFDWGEPVESSTREIDDRVVNWNFYYETPEAEVDRMGRRGLTVSHRFEVTLHARR